MIVKLQTEHYLEFLSLKGGCTGSSESTLVKMPHCWKSHVMAHIYLPAISKLIGTRSSTAEIYNTSRENQFKCVVWEQKSRSTKCASAQSGLHILFDLSNVW